MLTKIEVKACLAGEVTPIAPAYFFWFDEKFIEKNIDFVNEMYSQHSDDIIQTYPQLKKRTTNLPLLPGEYSDEWGCLFSTSLNGVGSHPSRPIINSIDGWEEYKDRTIPKLHKGFYEQQAVSKVKDNPDSYVLMNIWRTFYERMYMLYGMEQLWIDIATKGELFIYLLRDLEAFTLECIQLASTAGVDGVYLADDWGMQDRLQISPESWIRYFKPAYANMIDLAHEKGMQVWMHSCGCIDRLIPEWIDINLDVIGNLQTSAMNLLDISETYRGKITFFGGLDIQSNFINKSPETVIRDVKEIAALFKPELGNYIFAPCNTIMPETPPENVRAMFNAIEQYRVMNIYKIP